MMGSLMEIIVLLSWLGVAILAGICLLIVVPWTAARIAGRKWVEKVSNWYVWLAQTAVTKSAFIARSGEIELVAKRYDSEQKADKDTADGDARHHRDSFGALSRLQNKTFGIGLNSHDPYVSPLLAELGEHARRAKDRGQIGPTGQQMHDGMLLDKASTLVDLTEAQHLPTGDAEPESGREAYEKTKISQERFNERVSFGQGMLIIVAAIGSMLAMWFMTGYGDDGGTDATVSWIALMAVPAFQNIDVTERELAAAAYAVGWLVVIPLLAIPTLGIFSIFIPAIMLIVGGSIPLTVALMGPNIPTIIGLPLAKGFWILAQLTVGRGVLVERETGEYEHHALRDIDHSEYDYVCLLDDGSELGITGSPGDFERFGWAPLAFTAEKGQANMAEISEQPPKELIADGGQQQITTQNTRQGYQAVLPVPDDDQWLVTLPQLWTWCRNTSEAKSIRQGRDKALTEHGGSQQMGGMVFAVSLMVVIVLGGLMGFLAGGGI